MLTELRTHNFIRTKPNTLLKWTTNTGTAGILCCDRACVLEWSVFGMQHANHLEIPFVIPHAADNSSHSLFATSLRLKHLSTAKVLNKPLKLISPSQPSPYANVTWHQLSVPTTEQCRSQNRTRFKHAAMSLPHTSGQSVDKSRENRATSNRLASVWFGIPSMTWCQQNSFDVHCCWKSPYAKCSFLLKTAVGVTQLMNYKV